MSKNIKVIKESNTGRNTKFYDPSKRKEMNKTEFVKEIKKGNYPNYHIRKINKINTPASNPDKSKNNNLG